MRGDVRLRPRRRRCRHVQRAQAERVRRVHDVDEYEGGYVLYQMRFGDLGLRRKNRRPDL